MKIAITAPVYLTNREHIKYLNLTTKSTVSANHEIVWLPCENYVNPELKPLSYIFDHEPSEVKVLYPTGQQSVSKAWNKGIEEGARVGCNYILVINTDIVFKSNAIDRLVDFAEKHSEAVMWTMTECPDLANIEKCIEDESFSEHPLFSCFMVKADFFGHVGRFDENFTPAYFEDNDMHARLALAELKAYSYGGARFYHFGSRTVKSDRALVNKNLQLVLQSQLYFFQKWGHLTVDYVEQMREVYYKHPYNEEDKPLSYWRQTKRQFKDKLPLSVKYPLTIILNIKDKRAILPSIKLSVRGPLVLTLNWLNRKKARLKLSAKSD
jgi:GT2 family glycosyltransferase